MEWAAPQTRVLGGPEACGPPDNAVLVDLRRLTIQASRWRVDASVANRTGVPLGVIRPHSTGTYFGLAVFRSFRAGEVARRARPGSRHVQLVADRFQPLLPRILAPGERWSGTFSGPGRLPRGRVVRVVLGRFTIAGRPPRGLFRGFFCVSEAGVRLA